MASKPEVSVVMTCFNHEAYISQAIESVLAQTYYDFELIIVDDGSTDATSEVIGNIKDPRINLLKQKNSGPSIALNRGIYMSQGNYIALMSGDDFSNTNRLENQIKQIETHQADIIFCLPEIIGPHSEKLSWLTCPVFFGIDFKSTAELYRIFFKNGNFLCAPSGFLRRSAVEQVGYFKNGLIQLQDFDYWIRACKKNLTIKLFKDHLLQYRHLFGMNLSDKRSNNNRIRVEQMIIFRTFFDDVPYDLFYEAFNIDTIIDPADDLLDIETDKAILLMNHSDEIARAIGSEKMVERLNDDDVLDKLNLNRSFDITDFFKSVNLIGLEDFYSDKKGAKFFGSVLYYYQAAIDAFLNVFIPSMRYAANQTQTEERIKKYLEQGNDQKAVKLARGIWFAQHLAGMYAYARQHGLIVNDYSPEKVYIRKPTVVGHLAVELFEGEATCPRPYIVEFNDAIVTGDANLVISHEGILLNDEMVDFPSEEYGIKSHYIRFRHKNKVLLSQRGSRLKRINEGILLSSDYNPNYFHWLVETLPKLLFVDSAEKYNDVPLLIPKGLHENLEAALCKVNIKGHRIVRLHCGEAYQVKRLICPSALSRVLDHYDGEVVFDKDIVLSHKWVSALSRIMRKGVINDRKPWRKIFLTRRKGIRIVENLKELEKLLLENYYEIIDLDGLSMDAQISLFSQAAVVVAPSGAALTNMLFCQPGVKIIALMSNHELTNYYLWPQLASIARLDLTTIAGQRLYNVTNRYSVHDDYTIDPELLLREISKIG